MRIKKGFVLREVAGQIMVIATGEASKEFHGMIRLNSSGKDIWTGLQEEKSEDEIVNILVDKYEIDVDTAKQDVATFIATMLAKGFLVNE
jgi:hypothetical protein